MNSINFKENFEKLSPMMKQYVKIKEMHKAHLLFFRLGDFYELFFDDAVVASTELEIVLTGKECGLSERAPMCGVPFHSADTYIAKLINMGEKVAICEQLTPPDRKGVVERGVDQIVTKGTLMESSALDEKTNNYVGSVYDYNHCYAISYADISTGVMYSILIDYDEDKLLISMTNNYGVNKIVVKSSEFDFLTIEEVIDLMDDDDDFQKLFEAKIIDTEKAQDSISDLDDIEIEDPQNHLLVNH